MAKRREESREREKTKKAERKEGRKKEWEISTYICTFLNNVHEKDKSTYIYVVLLYEKKRKKRKQKGKSWMSSFRKRGGDSLTKL